VELVALHMDTLVVLLVGLMIVANSVLLTGASGAGKSTLLRGALEYYGSGLIVLAPGTDEANSYIGLLENNNYSFKPFDDLEFHPELKEFTATGHSDMIQWLKARYAELKSDVDSNKEPRYKVLAVDTESAVGRMAYNATMAKFKYTEPPPAQSPTGASFYGHLRIVLESGARIMRAIRGLGVHWVVASHPTEADVTAIQQLGSAKSKIMPDLPGGFKNNFPGFFDVVLDVGIGSDNKHHVQWEGDPKRVTKSRIGRLAPTGRIALPVGSKASWITLVTALDKARAVLGEVEKSS
jgi:hypothetical protein